MTAECPFCGAGNHTIRAGYQVQCRDCGAEGPTRGTRGDAITAWNRQPARAELARVQPVVEAARKWRDWVADGDERSFEPASDLVDAVAALDGAAAERVEGGNGESVL